MQIIILAAGKGERLLPLTRNTPKMLLEIGEGLTLIESQLLSIEHVDEIDEIVLVIGYLAEQIEAKLRPYAVRTVYNPFYDISNNLVSLWFALSRVNQDFVVVNGDDVFHPSVLQGLVASETGREVVMVVDQKDQYDDDDMKVITQGHKVLEVGKTLSADQANGESVGMILFRNRGSRALRNTLDRMVRTPEGRGAFWLAAVQDLIDQGIEVFTHEVSPNDWAEVDFHPDRDFVRSNLQRYSPVLKKWGQQQR